MNFLNCRYEIQKAKITIGPLKCQQEEEEPFDIENEIKTLKENNELINETIHDMKDEISNEFSEIENRLEMLHPPKTTTTLSPAYELYRLKCTAEETNYQMINNKCVYYETSDYDYEDAKQKCSERFNNNGRLFEPKSWNENEVAYKTIKSLAHSNNWCRLNWWIGINDKKNDGHYVFESDETPVSYIPKWYSGYGAKGTTKNCVMFVNNQNSALWADYTCSSSYASVCEQNT